MMDQRRNRRRQQPRSITRMGCNAGIDPRIEHRQRGFRSALRADRYRGWSPRNRDNRWRNVVAWRSLDRA